VPHVVNNTRLFAQLVVVQLLYLLSPVKTVQSIVVTASRPSEPPALVAMNPAAIRVAMGIAIMAMVVAVVVAVTVVMVVAIAEIIAGKD